MTKARPITPTITHQVRAFLLSQGIDLKPWSGLDETYERLYELMARKKDDPGFWGPLSGLLASIIENATEERAGRLGEEQAELLRSWDVDRIVQDLREALAGARASGTPDGFASALPAQVMGGFLLLGLVAAGCGGSTSTVGDASADLDAAAEAEPADASGEHWSDGCELDHASVLYRTLDASEHDEYTKAELCTCFAGLNASWNDGLTELFETGTPDQIARALDEMIECCWFDPYALSSDFADARDSLLDGTLCYMALPYRGVAFPRRP